MRPADRFAVVAAIGVYLAWAAPGAAQEETGVARLGKAIAAQEALNADLRLATSRAQREADQEAARLDQDERDLGAAGITMAALRQARLDDDAQRTALTGVEDRARFFAEEVDRLDRDIA